MGAGPWSGRRIVVVVAVLACAPLVAFLLARTFVVQGFYAASDSMEPTIRKGETFLVWKVYRSVQPGDIVIIEDSGGWAAVPDARLVRRVIGVAGDTVKCCNGAERMVKPGFVWVTRDNRAPLPIRGSSEERGGAQVPLGDVVGMVWLRIYPFERFGRI